MEVVRLLEQAVREPLELEHEVYEITLGRAKPSLESGEALATRMGAPECAVRPFPDR